MRPPEPMTRKWLSEKNSFPVRGLVLYRWPKGWGCNIELLRITREEIDEKPADEVAYEIALSAVFRYMTSAVYDGETTPVSTTRGTMLAVPTMAFDLAHHLVPKVKKLLADGGGGLNLTVISSSQKMLARAITGSAKDAQAWNLPKLGTGSERKAERLKYEANVSVQKARAMSVRRKTLAKFWLKNSKGFYRRGLVFTSNAAGFWCFNMDMSQSGLDPVLTSSDDDLQLNALCLAVSNAAIYAFAAGLNYEQNDVTYLAADPDDSGVDIALDGKIQHSASERLAQRLHQSMKKHRHGIIGLSVIERCLVLAWDPTDEKRLDEYPFPLAPSEDPQTLDRWALDTLGQHQRRKTREKVEFKPNSSAAGQQPVDDDSDGSPSWRQELEIDDWVPLDEPIEDDETIDRRAMELADHEQSAALRRIRSDEPSGRFVNRADSRPRKSVIDYTGLPEDLD